MRRRYDRICSYLVATCDYPFQRHLVLETAPAVLAVINLGDQVNVTVTCSDGLSVGKLLDRYAKHGHTQQQLADQSLSARIRYPLAGVEHMAAQAHSRRYG